jgi:hypothetical protein
MNLLRPQASMKLLIPQPPMKLLIPHAPMKGGGCSMDQKDVLGVGAPRGHRTGKVLAWNGLDDIDIDNQGLGYACLVIYKKNKLTTSFFRARGVAVTQKGSKVTC